MLDKMIHTLDKIKVMLRSHKINPTSQRIEIAHAIFTNCEHMSAEQVFTLVNGGSAQVSKATVYNTLGLFVKHGLIREVLADPTRIFYDPNTAPHHHFYNTSTGVLMDIPVEDVKIQSLPSVPDGMKMEGVDVIVRMRPSVSDVN